MLQCRRADSRFLGKEKATMRTLGDPAVGRFSVDVEVANSDDLAAVYLGVLSSEKVRRTTIKGVVDSGAARFVLPAKVVKKLGLRTANKVKVRYADGRTAVRETARGAVVTLLGREDTFTAVVEPKRDTALIGAIVLEELDLLVDCTHRRLLPRDPRYQIAEIE
jgi:predicted aspartyl protease